MRAAAIAAMVALLCLSGGATSPARADVVRTGAAPAAADAPFPSPFDWGSTFHAMVPTRVLDSRTGVGFTGPVGPHETKDVSIGGANGIDPDAVAVALNLTVTEGTADSFVTVSPAGSPAPTASNVNFAKGQTIANAAVVRLAANGKVGVSNQHGAVHVVADVVGWFDAGAHPDSLFNAVTPTRVLDSRTPLGGWPGPLAAGEANIRTLVIGGRSPVPKQATSVVTNVTATNPSANSFVQVFPGGTSRPPTSTLNFAKGQTAANLAVVGLGVDGSIAVFNAIGTTDVVVDVVGYFDPTQGGDFHPVEPTRVLDDRMGQGAEGPWLAGQTRSVGVAGTPTIPTIPADAEAVIGNLTATNGTAGTFLTVAADIAGPPSTSSLNAGPGETIANLVVSELDGAGSLDIYNKLGQVDVVLDVAGWFAGSKKARPIYIGTAVGNIWRQAIGDRALLATGFSDEPAPGDYDGDGRWEMATANRATGIWRTYGTAGDLSFPAPPNGAGNYQYVLAVPGAYGGSGKTVPAWYREGDGTWFIQGQDPIQFGMGPTDPNAGSMTCSAIDHDIPAPADYDGDGITDLATYRPLTARWMIRSSIDGSVRTFTLGDPTKLSAPVPADYDDLGHAQPATFDGETAFIVEGHPTPYSSFGKNAWGFPSIADFDGDGSTDLSVLVYPSQATTAQWIVEDRPGAKASAIGTYTFPADYPYGLIVNVARLTLLYNWACSAGP